MACSDCGVFHGSPVCGACRAGTRILGILRSGQLPLSEERRVVNLLRGVAQELADLVESSLPAGGGSGTGPPPPKGESQGLTPGPGGGVKKEVDERSEYTYSEEAEEEQDAAEDQVEEPPPVGSGGDVSDRSKTGDEPSGAKEGAADKTAEGEKSRRPLHPNFDRNYLTKRLQLYPTGKASAQPRGEDGRERKSARTDKEETSHHRQGGEESGRSDKEVGYRSRRPAEPESPERPPLERRPQPIKKRANKNKRDKKKKKKNKGQKRRERAQDFKAWRTHSRDTRRGRWK